MFERSHETHIILDQTQVPKVILYIPFSVSEKGKEELYQMACRWQENIAASAKSYKKPVIVMHRQPAEKDEDYADMANVVHTFDSLTIPEDSIIYILAHGIGDSLYVASTRDGRIKITTNEMIDRAKQDGLTAALAEKMKPLRLYICEEEGANKFLAYNCAIALGPDYKKINLQYYEKKVGIPLNPNNANLITSKRAAINVMENNQPKKLIVGKAAEFKQTINVGEVLIKHGLIEEEKSYFNLFSFLSYFSSGATKKKEAEKTKETNKNDYPKRK